MKTIKKGISQLSGQKLVSVSVNAGTGLTRFVFDLGCELNCRRFERNSKDEIWMLYRPNGYVLSVHGDGSYRHKRSTYSERQRKLIEDSMDHSQEDY